MTPEEKSHDDAAIVEYLASARNGDQAAFSRLLNACYPAVFRLVFQIVPCFQDVEDILQDTFFRFHKALPRLRPGEDPLPFLKTIAVRRAYTFIRRSRRDHVSLEDLPSELPDLDLLGSPVSLEKVYSWVKVLPPRQRVVFILREILGHDDTEIAGMLSIRETTVRRHASLAREALKIYLGT